MPVPRMDGRFASRARAPEGERPMLLFEEAPPPLPSDPDESVLFPLGRTVARLHVAADELGSDFGIPAVRSEAFLGDCVEYSRPFLSEGDGAYLHEVATRLGRALESLPREAPGFGLCHADLVMSNLRRAADGTLVLFDFGAATRTWRAFELAVIHWSLGNRDADRRDALWPSVLRGYESVRPLPGGLVQHLPLMLVLRQIGFLGGNCATLPLRLGTEAIDAGFIERVMARLREFVDEAGIRGH